MLLEQKLRDLVCWYNQNLHILPTNIVTDISILVVNSFSQTHTWQALNVLCQFVIPRTTTNLREADKEQFLNWA